jgi:predicted unusual protein kinase regulating ubiquinone biosynthesis (AarF/ABC1/UbiB family)
VAGALGRRAARHGSTRLANVFRDPDEAKEMVERRHRETAAYLTGTLGTLRGGAAKLGQLASFIDVGLVPPEYRELYQSELAALRDSAPPMEWAQVRRVLEEEWGKQPESVLDELEQSPAAAASLGQVHRARLPAGRRVAIKVQYPEVAEAFGNEIRSVARLVPLARGVAPALDAGAVAAELAARALEELDYRIEGGHQAAFARAYRDHPFIYVPAVHRSLTRRRVLVSDWIDGLRFPGVLELPQPERDRFGEILFRFYFGATRAVERFNADPHPGNYLLRSDGSVGFVDFGAVKATTSRFFEDAITVLRAGMAGDAHAVRAAVADAGFFRKPELVDPDLVMRWLRVNAGWMLDDRPVTIDAEIARRLLPLTRQGAFDIARGFPEVDMPAEDLLFGRMRTALVAVLAQLQATANWNVIAREWFDDEAPRTSLGHAEAAFFSRAV